MATHSTVLAWRIPGMGEPGGLPSMGLHRVWHDWSDLAAAEDTGQEEQNVRGRGWYDSSCTKEWDQMNGYNDVVMHYPCILVKTEVLTPLVGCLQSTPEPFFGNCFQWRSAALPKIKLQFREQFCLNWSHHSYWGFPGSSVGKESTYNAGDPGLIPGSGRSSGEGIGYPLQHSWASLVAQLVKNPPAMWETWVQSLGWEDPLEKGKAPHSSILAWKIPCTV